MDWNMIGTSPKTKLDIFNLDFLASWTFDEQFCSVAAAISQWSRRILEEQLDTAVDHEVNIKLSRAGEVMNIHLRVVDFHKLLLGAIKLDSELMYDFDWFWWEATETIQTLPSGELT